MCECFTKLNALGNGGNDGASWSVVDLVVGTFPVKFVANAAAATTGTDDNEDDDSKSDPTDDFSNTFEFVNAFVTC